MHLTKHKSNRKGFTLVELIVVLVILGILAALLVPALTGYIDKAKQKKIIANGVYAYKAAQTLASEAYGTGWVTATIPTVDQVKELAEVNGTIGLKFTQPGIVDATAASPFTYTEDGITAYYEDGTWRIGEAGNSGSSAGIASSIKDNHGADVNPADSDFFQSGWETTAYEDQNYQVKRITYDGKDYSFVYQKGTEVSSADAKKIADADNVIVFSQKSDGSFFISGEGPLKAIASAMGYDNAADKPITAIVMDASGNIILTYDS